jgi:hypothetical protein
MFWVGSFFGGFVLVFFFLFLFQKKNTRRDTSHSKRFARIDAASESSLLPGVFASVEFYRARLSSQG